MSKLSSAVLPLALACCFFSLLKADPTASPKPVISLEAELAAKAIQVPAGFTLKTVASEPNLANGVSFCFDPSGRIFVAETYRVGKGIEDDRSHMDWLDDDLACQTVADRRAYLIRHLGDKVHKFEEASEQVRLLEDRDGDGLYETSSIFSTGYKNIEDGTAAGVLWHNDRLLFTCIPSLWELRDRDGDGKAEERRALSTGYGVRTSFYGHDLHGLCKGPDSRIYFSIGDRGLNVQTPNGVIVNTNSGAVLRCQPDGSQLEIFATGLRNPQELAFNEFGDLFTVDNNSDSGDKARLVYIVEGMDAGWRMPYQYLSDRGPFNREKIWEPQNDEQPASIVPPVANITDGPSGLVHYPGTGLPKTYDGAFFVVDFRGAPATSGIREFYTEQQGSTYRLTKYKTFVSGVLASDCDFGPNGDFYILDWVEGWVGPGKGRIHRVTSEDPDAVKQRAEMQAAMRKVPSASVRDLIALLGHPNMRVRQATQERLVAIGEAATSSLKTLVANNDAPLFARIHAIWALGEVAENKPELFESIALLCDDKNLEVRAQAARTLERAAKSSEDARQHLGHSLIPLLADASPRVRSFAAISLGKLRDTHAATPLMQMAAKDGNDPVLRHAIARALSAVQSDADLAAAATGANDAERLVLVVALGKQKSPLVAKFLKDSSDRIVLEAARIIWDTPIPTASAQLAALIDQVPPTSDPLARRVLAANISGRSPDNLRAIIRFAYQPQMSDTLRDLAWNQVRTWAAPSSRDSVDGDWRPLEARPKTDVVNALREAMPKLTEVAATNPGGLILAAEFEIEDAYHPLLAVLANDAQPEATRATALSAFAKAPDSIAHQAIETGLKSPHESVRVAARKLWADRFPSEVVDQLQETLDSGVVHERQSALDTLAGLRTPPANAVVENWLERLERGECPAALQIEVLDAAAKSNDAHLVERQKQFVEKLAGEGPLKKFSGCLDGGDAERGRKIFDTNDKLACRRCHSTKPGETLVGPCLANVGGQRKAEEILESIVLPNAKICEGFDTAVLQLDSGKVVTGIIRHETASKIELVDAAAKTVIVDPSTVESRVKGKSAMPENLIDQMTQRELRDLVAFLSQLKTSEPTATSNSGAK
ncbi:MAG TPA: PVC-type heme-binding CxxCH protein [Lacipirellulaceae bacterium]|nr:PVC-type heme-binding CxxCH protein [Lacipirellulaceae bacterium]